MNIMNQYRMARAASFFLLVFAASTTAVAGWEVINLHPAGATSSEASAVSGARQAGYVGSDWKPHAALWSGTAESWVDLHPDGYTASWIADISGEQQAGSATVPGEVFGSHAGMWSGTVESWVDLHPDGYIYISSSIAAIFGEQQVGSVNVPGGGEYWGLTHAAMWSGSAESWVDLNPAGAIYSSANGASGGQQVGWADFFGFPGSEHPHAGLWTGSADSWVDLHPTGPNGPGSSYAADVSDGQQVGAATFSDGLLHAGLWSGTAESWVDLNPPGSTASEASGVAGGRQVGYATIGNIKQAVMWSGTAASFFDLHDLLGPEYSASEAQSINVSGIDIWVAGIAYRGEIRNAVLWHYTVPEPASLVALSGILGMSMIRRKRRSNDM